MGSRKLRRYKQSILGQTLRRILAGVAFTERKSFLCRFRPFSRDVFRAQIEMMWESFMLDAFRENADRFGWFSISFGVGKRGLPLAQCFVHGTDKQGRIRLTIFKQTPLYEDTPASFKAFTRQSVRIGPYPSKLRKVLNECSDNEIEVLQADCEFRNRWVGDCSPLTLDERFRIRTENKEMIDEFIQEYFG